MKSVTDTDTTEFWQRGPVPGIPALLQPVAHTLLQLQREISVPVTNIGPEKLWKTPAGVASPGFHLQHMSGVLDRIFTYAAGTTLSEQQFSELAAEGSDKSQSAEALAARFNRQVDRALQQLAKTDPATLTEIRYIGRKKIPTTQLGLLFHAAEHLMRHTGQLLVTCRILEQET